MSATKRAKDWRDWLAFSPAVVVLGVFAGIMLDITAIVAPLIGLAVLTGVVLALVLLVKRLAFSTGVGSGIARAATRQRLVVAHSHGHDWKAAAKHEAGHAAVARGVGGRVISVEINESGGGLTRSVLPKSVTPTEQLAFSMGGCLREGVNPHTHYAGKGDRVYMKEEIRAGGDVGEARRVARRHIHSWYASGVESRLLRNGRA